MLKTSKSSDRQKEIFQFIKAFLLEKGYPPSVREIGEAVGLKSSSTVHSYLSRLEANGMIKRDPTKPRAIDILDERPWRQNVPVPMLIGIMGAAQAVLDLHETDSHRDTIRPSPTASAREHTRSDRRRFLLSCCYIVIVIFVCLFVPHCRAILIQILW